MRLTTTLALVTAGFSTLASAQTERELGSHEHGSAFLNIAVDDGQVFLELESPWDNLVGFEHAPSTDEQHELVDNAIALLNQPEQLFSFDGGGCVADDATVESGMASGDDDHHDEHAHDDNHDKDDDQGMATIMTNMMRTLMATTTTQMREHTLKFWQPIPSIAQR